MIIFLYAFKPRQKFFSSLPRLAKLLWEIIYQLQLDTSVAFLCVSDSIVQVMGGEVQ